MSVVERDHFFANNENDRQALQKLEKMLNGIKHEGALSDVDHLPMLVSSEGEEIELPVSVFQILSEVVSHMMLDRTISIVPLNKELSTQQAADLFFVSRPHLVGLLETGKIPFVKVGTHRRIRFVDLMAYKHHRYEERQRALAAIAHISEDEQLYD